MTALERISCYSLMPGRRLAELAAIRGLPPGYRWEKSRATFVSTELTPMPDFRTTTRYFPSAIVGAHSHFSATVDSATASSFTSRFPMPPSPVPLVKVSSTEGNEVYHDWPFPRAPVPPPPVPPPSAFAFAFTDDAGRDYGPMEVGMTECTLG